MSDQGYWRSSMRWCAQTRTSFISMRLAEGSKVPREMLKLLPRTVIPSAAEGSPLQTGKRWVFDDEKREVLSLPPRTPVVISGVQERFLDFARNDDTGKALSSEPRNLKAGIRDERLGILALFDEMVRANAHLFYKYAACGGIESA